MSGKADAYRSHPLIKILKKTHYQAVSPFAVASVVLRELVARRSDEFRKHGPVFSRLARFLVPSLVFSGVSHVSFLLLLLLLLSESFFVMN